MGTPQPTGVIPAGGAISQSATVPVPSIPGEYYIWVLADYNEVLEQTNSDNDDIVSLPLAVTSPVAPGAFTLAADPPVCETTEPAGPAVGLHWTESINALGYEVYRDGTKIYPTNGATASRAYIDRVGLIPGEIYTYYVVARTGDDTETSNNIQVGPIPAAPAKPRIASISPEFMEVIDEDATLAIEGSNFGQEAVIHLYPPSGGYYIESAFEERSSNELVFRFERFSGSFMVKDGDWKVEVKNPDGQMSGRAVFHVGAYDSLNYSALGDSYSSGEGYGFYAEGTDENEVNECHRSSQTYSSSYRNDRFPQDLTIEGDLFSVWRWHLACSGAKTNNIIDEDIRDANTEETILRKSPQWNEGKANWGTALTQLEQLQNWADPEGHARTPEVITLTIGGNDAGFVPVLVACLLFTDCYDSVADEQASLSWREYMTEQAIPKAAQNVAYTLERIRAIAGNDAAIYLLGYPHIFPESKEDQSCLYLTDPDSLIAARLYSENPGLFLFWPSGLPLAFAATRTFWGIAPEEQDFLRAMTDLLNEEISAAASAAGVDFIQVSGEDAYGDFQGHEVCGPNGSWINGLVFDKHGLIPAAESFHPNMYGQGAYRRAIEEYIEKNGFVLGSGNEPELESVAALREEVLQPASDAEIATFDDLTVSVSGQSLCASKNVLEVNRRARIQGSGFLPYASVDISVSARSEPYRVFGTVSADGLGRIDSEVSLSDEGLVSTIASIKARGVGANGRPRSLMGWVSVVESLHTDTDNDGIPDVCDSCRTNFSIEDMDSDGDGRGDVCDVCPSDPHNDVDQDGVCATQDVCPFDSENDQDGDGLCEVIDNCPAVTNPEQSDANGDGIGDACDPDDFEPDDSSEQATPLTAGGPQTHNLLGAGDQDWLSFRVATETHLVVRAQANDDGAGNLSLRLYTPNLQSLSDWAFSSESPPTARLDAFSDCASPGLPPGDYLVQVSGDLSRAAPGYEIGLSVLDCDGIADLDADSVPDSADNCPIDPNTEQTDLDLDGLGDVCDENRDGDGADNGSDPWPDDPSEWRDQDSDGVGDNADADDDGDGQPDDAYEPDNWREQAVPLIAGDRQAHTLIGAGDQDWATFELAGDTHLVVRALGTDVESGYLNLTLYRGTETWYLTRDTSNWELPPDVRADYSSCDGPGLAAGDYAVKVDGSLSGEAAGYELALYVIDCDGGADLDTDVFPDSSDNCPIDPNDGQEDLDADGRGDLCDLDRDGDGYHNDWDAWPNDPTEWRDQDGDLIGDNADPDDDGDGEADDAYEPDNWRDLATPLLAGVSQTHTLIGYRDQDRLSFSVPEDTHLVVQAVAAGTDPEAGRSSLQLYLYAGDNEWLSYSAYSAQAPPAARLLFADCSAPGLPAGDYSINVSGVLYGSAPEYEIGLNVMDCENGTTDVDGDGEPDASDNCPIDTNSDQADLDQDGLGDVCDSDRDGDGWHGEWDVFPSDATEWQDEDGDNLGDNADTDDDGDGQPDDAYEPDNWRDEAALLVAGEVQDHTLIGRTIPIGRASASARRHV